VAARLQGQISDALLQEGGNIGIAVVPVVHVPLLHRSRARIELCGQVGTAQARDAARRVVAREASRMGVSADIDDRLRVAHAA
jgi:hypothetical protein